MDNILHVCFLADLRLKHMATNPESTNQGIPFDGNPSPFPPFGNIGAPYMATLSLLDLQLVCQYGCFQPPLFKML